MSSEKIDKDFLVNWFLKRYEDPANNTPYESREGGYIYLYGGPYDARDELEDNFPDNPSALDDAIEELEAISIDWAKKPTEEDFLGYAIEQRKIVLELTDETIRQNAFKYVKSEKNTIKDLILRHRNKTKKVIFMAGSPGAGKTEMALGLSQHFAIDSIEADKIRQYCPHYNGHNSHLFQRASSKAVSVLVDYAFKNDISFILDGNFANYDIQKENIKRAINKGYEVEIRFVSIDIEDAKQYTVKREKIEGRRITDEVFKDKYRNSISTVQKFFGEVPVHFYDLSKREVVSNIDKQQFIQRLKSNMDKLGI